MARGTVTLARAAVVVRAGAAPLWWLGIAAAAAGAWQDGLTGQWIGLYAGAALFLVVAPAVYAVRRGRVLAQARKAQRAGRGAVLQDRAVTLRTWRRARRWWLAAAFAVAAGSAAAMPIAAWVGAGRSRCGAAGEGRVARPPGAGAGGAAVAAGRRGHRPRRRNGRFGRRVPPYGHRRRPTPRRAGAYAGAHPPPSDDGGPGARGCTGARVGGVRGCAAASGIRVPENPVYCHRHPSRAWNFSSTRITGVK